MDEYVSYSPDQYRSLFPHIQTGKIWLNHAAISPLSKRVHAVVEKHLQNRSFGDIDVYPSVLDSCERAKRNLGALINAAPERIGFVPNTSEGLNILANGVDWKSGDRILLNDIEFPTNVVPFLNLKRFGVEVDFVKSRNGEVLTDDLAAALTPRTRLLSISSVQFLSGYRADLAAVGALCRSKDVLFCVDAIQGLGVSPHDVQAMQIDFLTAGGNKWLMGLMGFGFVFVTEELQARLTQRHAGWTSNRNFFGDFFTYRIDLDETARRYENGTQNYVGIAALAESTATLLEAGVDAIRDHVLELTGRIIAFADENGFGVVTPRDPAKRAGIVTLTHPKASEIFAELTEQRIVVSLREGMLRIAPHFYSSDEDLHALFGMLRLYTAETA